jgi:predicted  nucleic acid-binding Zn-ribbon protein
MKKKNCSSTIDFSSLPIINDENFRNINYDKQNSISSSKALFDNNSYAAINNQLKQQLMDKTLELTKKNSQILQLTTDLTQKIKTKEISDQEKNNYKQIIADLELERDNFRKQLTTNSKQLSILSEQEKKNYDNLLNKQKEFYEGQLKNMQDKLQLQLNEISKNSLQSSLNENDKTIYKSLIDENNKLLNNIREMTSNLTLKEKEINDLTNLFTQQQFDYKKLEAESNFKVKALEMQLSDLQSSLTKIESMSANTSLEKQEKSYLVEQKNREIADLQNKLSIALQEKENTITYNQQFIEKQQQEYTSNINILQQQYSSQLLQSKENFNFELQKLSQEKDFEKKNLLVEINNHKSIIDDLKIKLSTLNSSNSNDYERSKLLQKIQGYENQISEYNNLIKTKEQSIYQFSLEINQYKNDINNLQQSLNEKDNIISTLNFKVSQRENEIKNYNNDIINLNNQIDNLKQKHIQLSSQEQQENLRNIGNLQNEIKTLQLKKDQLTNDNYNLTNQLSILQNKDIQVNQELENLRQKNRTEAAKYENEIKNMNQVLNESEYNYNNIKQQYDNQINSLQNKNIELQKQLDIALQNINEYKYKLEQINEKCIALESEIRNLNNQIQKLNNEQIILKNKEAFIFDSVKQQLTTVLSKLNLPADKKIILNQIINDGENNINIMNYLNTLLNYCNQEYNNNINQLTQQNKKAIDDYLINIKDLTEKVNASCFTNEQLQASIKQYQAKLLSNDEILNDNRIKINGLENKLNELNNNTIINMKNETYNYQNKIQLQEKALQDQINNSNILQNENNLLRIKLTEATNRLANSQNYYNATNANIDINNEQNIMHKQKTNISKNNRLYFKTPLALIEQITIISADEWDSYMEKLIDYFNYLNIGIYVGLSEKQNKNNNYITEYQFVAKTDNKINATTPDLQTAIINLTDIFEKDRNIDTYNKTVFYKSLYKLFIYCQNNNNQNIVVGRHFIEFFNYVYLLRDKATQSPIYKLPYDVIGDQYYFSQYDLTNDPNVARYLDNVFYQALYGIFSCFILENNIMALKSGKCNPLSTLNIKDINNIDLFDSNLCFGAIKKLSHHCLSYFHTPPGIKLTGNNPINLFNKSVSNNILTLSSNKVKQLNGNKKFIKKSSYIQKALRPPTKELQSKANQGLQSDDIIKKEISTIAETNNLGEFIVQPTEIEEIPFNPEEMNINIKNSVDDIYFSQNSKLSSDNNKGITTYVFKKMYVTKIQTQLAVLINNAYQNIVENNTDRMGIDTLYKNEIYNQIAAVAA